MSRVKRHAIMGGAVGLALLAFVLATCGAAPARPFHSPLPTAQAYRYYWPIWFGGHYETPALAVVTVPVGTGAPGARATRTATAAVTLTGTAKPTRTARQTATRTPTTKPSVTATQTVTPTRTPTSTRTAKWTPTATATATPTRTKTPTRAPAPTATRTIAPTRTATQAPAATATAQPGPSTKLGLGGCVNSCATLGCTWCYGWNAQPGTGADHERVPMLWGRANVGTAVGGNSQWLMGFNEPDLEGQANLSTGQAAELWRDVERLYPGRKLVAPAPSDVWIDWLPNFRYAYMSRYGVWPRLDALAFHCYKHTANECIAIGQQFVAWALAWNVPEVWCSEFAFLPAWSPDAEGEARRFVAWLEGEPRVTRYAPFVSYVQGGEWWWPWTSPGTNPSIFNADMTTLTEIGRWYAR